MYVSGFWHIHAHIIDECKENDVYCPIEQVEGRVKSVSSILEKMQRKHIPMERMEEELEDIAGVRIICQFEEDIETVASLIQKRSDMVIKSEKNYLKHIKQSGYRSYHLIIYYTVDTIKGPKKLQAEIQIRTMAMNFWATIEHSLQYKYKGDMPEHVAERLSKAADAINALDHEMSSVRNEIMDAQNSSQMQSNLVKDILINIENLYKIANKREIMKIQDEFLRVFKTKDLQQPILQVMPTWTILPLVLRSSADCWRVVGIKWGSFLSLTGERRRVFRYLESLDWDFWCLREIWTLW